MIFAANDPCASGEGPMIVKTDGSFVAPYTVAVEVSWCDGC